MSSLTIRLDAETKNQLEHLASITNKSKSVIARTSILEYLKKYQTIENSKKKLAEEATVSSISEVRERALISESGNYLTDDEYEQEMDIFFRKELGLIR